MARGWKFVERVGLRKPVQLQWGRGGWPADGATGMSLGGLSGGFNGAAGVGPRMESTVLFTPTVTKRWLQWGRGGWPADGYAYRYSEHRYRHASMGPRGLARGWLLESYG